MPKQPGYHKRLKASRGLLCKAIRVLARVCPSWADDLWITDVTWCQVDFSGVLQMLGPGRTRRVPVLRELLSLLLGSEALPGLRR